MKHWTTADRIWLFCLMLTAALIGTYHPSSAQQQLSSALIAYDYEALAPTSSAAVGLTASKVSAGPGAKGLYCTTETAPVRWRSDGTSPTTSEGHLVAQPGVISLGDTNQITRFRVIAVSTTAAVKCSLLK